ncbi:reverse transcriptase [Plakobranchus ocellatus]|uniref:Reverse transcriptase n=1 Tax=Plakobranchus ocellatus TaxID=259542 RepID=A0AAV3YIP2_9GAST|nr:reverse transcriptase [Plakobranchus ocellatus]
MFTNSEDPAVRSTEPQLSIGRKWRVDEAIIQVKKDLKREEVIGLTQTERKGFGSEGIKWRPKNRSCSSPNRLQRPVINKQKASGTSWTVIKESTVLAYSSYKRAGHAHILLLPRPMVQSGRIPVMQSFSYLSFAAKSAATLWNLEVTLLFASL